jgi:hypothetical protein
MSINGVDYTKQLAKDREYFQDAVSKTKKSAERRIDDTNKRADHIITKQRNNFIEDKAELENNYQKNLEELKENTKSSLAGNSTKFHKDMEAERENFTQESLKKSKDFDQRLNDIKSSYSKAFDSEKDRNEDMKSSMKKKYDQNISSISEDSDEKLQSYQDQMTSKGASLKDQYNREREQLVRAQEDRLTGAYKDASHKRADLKDRIGTELKKSKEVHESEMDHQRQYTQDRLATMQDKFQDRYETMATDYSQRNARLVNTQQESAVQTNREHQEKVADIRREFNGELRHIDLERRRRDNGSGEFAEVVNRQQGLKDQVINDNKVKHLKDELVDAQRSYQHRADRDQSAFNVTLHEEAAEATARLDRKLNEANANKIITVSREREKAEDQIQNRELQNRLDKASYEAKLMNEHKNANERINKLKENFTASMKTLNEKHQARLEDVTKTTNKDKKVFVEKMQESRANENFEMKREFTRMMDATVQDYEQRLANFQRDNEYLKMTMDQKIQGIIEQTEKQLSSQKTLFDDRRAADIKGQQLLMDQRENQLKKNAAAMNLNFQKKIDKMQIESESKLKLITNDYETKLKELKATVSKDLAAKDMSHQVELDRVKRAYEDEKVRTVEAYEVQIDSIKKGHKDQMDQMLNYKRLS